MSTTDLEPLARLSRDLKQAAGTLGDDEARYLVDSYYQMQDQRKALNNQMRAFTESEEPHDTIAHFAGAFDTLEQQIKGTLDVYSMAQPLGEWARSIVGVGPVITAGLLAHIDIERARTAGAIWRFAGLDPSARWEKGQKRPWNAELKTLCWKLSDSFVKFHNRKDCFYGQLYVQRKEFEVQRNEAVREVPEGVRLIPLAGREDVGTFVFDGEAHTCHLIGDKWFYGGNAEAAQQTLLARRINDKATRAVYESGKTPPGRVDLRARRWVVKLFLAHWHEVGYTLLYGKPPADPYPITHLGHAHRITPPNWP